MYIQGLVNILVHHFLEHMAGFWEPVIVNERH